MEPSMHYTVKTILQSVALTVNQAMEEQLQLTISYLYMWMFVILPLYFVENCVVCDLNCPALTPSPPPLFSEE